MQILYPLDIVGGHSLILHLPAVVGNIVPDMLNLFYQKPALQSFYLVSGGSLYFFLKISFHITPFPGSGILAKLKCLDIYIVEFLGDNRLYGLLPGLIRHIEIVGESAHEHKVNGL